MNWIVSTAIKLPVIVLGLCVGLLVFGFRSVLYTAPMDVFPNSHRRKWRCKRKHQAYPRTRSKAW